MTLDEHLCNCPEQFCLSDKDRGCRADIEPLLVARERALDALSEFATRPIYARRRRVSAYRRLNRIWRRRRST